MSIYDKRETDWLFDAVDSFMSVRATARAEYLRTLDNIKDMAGSKRYEDLRSEAAAKRDATIGAAQAEARATVSSCIARMQKSAKSIAAKPPTTEQLNILAVLKMRERPSQADFDSAANALSDNDLCLSALDEMAARAGLIGGYKAMAGGGDLTTESALSEILLLSDACNTIIDSVSGASPVALMVRKMHVERYGGEIDEYGLPEMRRFADKYDFYNTVTHSGYSTLSRAVNTPDPCPIRQ